jgi:hypothetical protein
VTDRLHAGIAVLSATFVGATFAVRWALTPVRETRPYSDGHPTVVTPIDDLKSVGEWEPVYGTALDQARRAAT